MYLFVELMIKMKMNKILFKPEEEEKEEEEKQNKQTNK